MRYRFAAACVTALGFAGACTPEAASPWSALLEVDNGPAVEWPDEGILDWYSRTRHLLVDHRVPAEGTFAPNVSPLITVLVQSSTVAGEERRAFVKGYKEGRLISWAAARVKPPTGRSTVTVKLVLGAWPPPDRDGDGIPDAIDDCEQADPSPITCIAPAPDGSVPEGDAAPIRFDARADGPSSPTDMRPTDAHGMDVRAPDGSADASPVIVADSGAGPAPDAGLPDGAPPSADAGPDPSEPPPAPNLVRNPTFKDGTTNWTRVRGSGVAGSPGRTDDRALHETQTDAWWQQLLQGWRAGQRYEVRVWGKGTGSACWAGLQGAPGGNVATLRINLGPFGSTWSQKSARVTIPGDLSWLQVFVRNAPPTGSTGECAIDDVELVASP